MAVDFICRPSGAYSEGGHDVLMVCRPAGASLFAYRIVLSICRPAGAYGYVAPPGLIQKEGLTC